MMKCLIIDDEPLAREGLTKYVKEIDFLILSGTASNPVELSKKLEKESIDLIFLDIQMPLMNGIEFLKIAQNPPLVIITTAHSSYAIEGYQLDVVDYLLKPITFNRFFKAVNKAREVHNYKHPNNDYIEQASDDQFFFVKCESRYEKIRFEDILFVEAMQNYVQIHTIKGKFTTLLYLKNLEASLPKDQFKRIHKSYIISISKVDQIDKGELQINGIKIPVSRSLKKEVLDRILGKRYLG